MKKIKIVTVFGTRPEIIRLSAVIKLLDSMKNIHQILIHTGQNYDYELNQIFFEDLNIRKPDYYLDSSKSTAIQTISTAMISIEPILIKEKPDAFIVLGDTNSALTSIVANKLSIPIFHLEAGNRSFDKNVPEETNRKIVDHIADINLPYTRIAREYLIREGIHPSKIIVVGAPLKEVIYDNLERIENSDILNTLNIEKQKYILISLHRQENLINDESIYQIIKFLNHLIDVYNLPIIFSLHPRTRKRFLELNISFDEKIKLLNPFSFSDYCHLQKWSKVVLSDSGSINEESSLLKFPAINIRESHERPESMESAITPLAGFSIENIDLGLELVMKKQYIDIVKDYENLNFSYRVVNAVISYYRSKHREKNE